MPVQESFSDDDDDDDNNSHGKQCVTEVRGLDVKCVEKPQ